MDQIVAAFLAGLPIVLADLGTALGLLVFGVMLYEAITPYRELRLIREGNAAAGLALGGALLSMAIPLAAALRVSVSVLDILIWGSLAIFLQLLVFLVLSRTVRTLTAAIARGEVASATLLVSAQLSMALLNAAVMAG